MTEKVVTNKSVSAIVLRCYDCLVQEVKEIKLHLSNSNLLLSFFCFLLLDGQNIKNIQAWVLMPNSDDTVESYLKLFISSSSNQQQNQAQMLAAAMHGLSNELLANMMRRRFHWFCNLAILSLSLCTCDGLWPCVWYCYKCITCCWILHAYYGSKLLRHFSCSTRTPPMDLTFNNKDLWCFRI